MKKARGWLLIITAISGLGISIFNGTGEEIIKSDGTTFELEKVALKKNISKEYSSRELLKDSLWIDIHCSATVEDYKVNNMAIWHVDGHNWPGIGYHALIRNNGDLYLGNHLEQITYHNSGQNSKSIGICLIGDFDYKEIDDDAIKTLKALTDEMCLTLKIKGIRGHCDNPNTSKTCPGTLGYKQLVKLGIITNPNVKKFGKDFYKD